MCHVVGYTPEARTVEDALRGRPAQAAFAVGSEGMRRAYDSVCASGEGKVDFVSLGCPHYDIEQIKRTARCLEGKKIHAGVHFMVWIAYPIKCMADGNGYTRTIEDADGHLYTSTCPATIGQVFLKRYNGLVFDSLKQAGSVKSEVDMPVYFGDALHCIDAAVAGRWEGGHRCSGQR